MDLDFDCGKSKLEITDGEESESSKSSAETWPYFPFFSLHPEIGKKHKSQLGKRRSRLKPVKFDCDFEIESKNKTPDYQKRSEVEKLDEESEERGKEKVEEDIIRSDICEFNTFSVSQDPVLDKENVSKTSKIKIPDNQKLKKEYLIKNEYPIGLNPFQPKKPYPILNESNVLYRVNGNISTEKHDVNSNFFKPSLFPSECIANRFGTITSSIAAKSENSIKTAFNLQRSHLQLSNKVNSLNYRSLKIPDDYKKQIKYNSTEVAKQNVFSHSDSSFLKNEKTKSIFPAPKPLNNPFDVHPKQENAPIVSQLVSDSAYDSHLLSSNIPAQKTNQCHSTKNPNESLEFGVNTKLVAETAQLEAVKVAKSCSTDSQKHAEFYEQEIFKQPAVPNMQKNNVNSRPVLPVMNSKLSKAKPVPVSNSIQQSVKNGVLHIGSEEESNFSTNASIRVNHKLYRVLSVLGRGGSSEVYQVLDPDTSKLLAIKCVDLSSVDKTIAEGYLNEVALLERLQGCSSVICMFDHQFIIEKKQLYVVMEKGDTDLAGLIKDISKTKKISMSMIVYYWTEMLIAVQEIHEKGIIHSDLKPANFLLVSGRLKLIDFGIASSLQGDMTSVHKEVTTGTWNYMSPEALKNTAGNGAGFKISCKSDVWSLGCILYNLVYGRTPFSHISNTWGKLMAIADPTHAIPFPDSQMPPVLRSALRSCLWRDPKQRLSVKELINLPYHASALPYEIASQIKQILPSNWYAAISHLLPENSANDRTEKSSSEIK